MSTPNFVLFGYLQNFLSKDECNEIFALAGMMPMIEGLIGRNENQKNENLRNNMISFFDSDNILHTWIFDKIYTGMLDMNQQFWQFELEKLETVQFSKYGIGQHYGDHMDMSWNDTYNQRKLSCSIQLSDPDSYQGGDLQFHQPSNDYVTAPRDLGAIVVFPSFSIHRVTPVTQGERHSLVGWAVGRHFK